MSLPSDSSGASDASTIFSSSGSRSASIPAAGLGSRARADSDNDSSVGTRIGTDVSRPSSGPANPRGRSVSARASPASPGALPAEPSVSRSNSSTTQPGRRSLRQAVQGSESRSTATRRVGIRRNHQRVNFNPDAPPSATAALAAGQVLDESNVNAVSTVSLNQPSRIRLPQTIYPRGESQPPISTDALHQGLTAEEAVQRSRRRVGRSPQAARNEGDRLSDEVRTADSKRD